MIFVFLGIVAIGAALYHYAHHKAVAGQTTGQEIAGAAWFGVEYALVSFIVGITLLVAIVLILVALGVGR